MISPRQARTRIQHAEKLMAQLSADRVAAAILELHAQIDDSVWRASGEPGTRGAGGHSDPTAAVAGSRQVQAAINALDAAETQIRALEMATDYLLALTANAKEPEPKGRCGELSPSDVRRDPWFDENVVGCHAIPEVWVAADGSERMRSSGLCAKHRRDWDRELRQREAGAA